MLKNPSIILHQIAGGGLTRIPTTQQYTLRAPHLSLDCSTLQSITDVADRNGYRRQGRSKIYCCILPPKINMKNDASKTTPVTCRALQWYHMHRKELKFIKSKCASKGRNRRLCPDHRPFFFSRSRRQPRASFTCSHRPCRKRARSHDVNQRPASTITQHSTHI